jgi:GntR family transcriptional repressor for pyruvate dehydrogenase complex
VLFHRAIADAARNPFLIGTLEYLSQFLRGATQVTRANEARRAFAARWPRSTSASGAPSRPATRRPRAAAAGHMDNAIRRIEQADPAFWQQQGEALAEPLIRR